MKRAHLLLVVLALLIAFGLTAGVLSHGADVLSHGPVMMHPQKLHFELAADSVVVPVTLVDGRVIVDVTLDGKGPFPFIFDTGAHGSVMDLEFAREQGLALGGEITVSSPGGAGRPGRQVTVGTLAMGGLSLEKVQLIAFDGLPFPRTADSPRGVLGPYGLSGLLIALDYPGQRVVFRRGALPEPDGREVFGWDRAAGLPEIPAKVDGLEVPMHLDSGASTALSLPTAFIDRLTLDGPLVDMGFAKLVDQVRPVRGARLKGNVTIGRYTVVNPTVRFVDLAKGIGNVGAPVLRRLVLTIDPANRRYRLAGPEDGILEVTETRKPRYGVQLESIEADPLQVVFVDSGSPAEKAGLVAGDRILRLNGRPLADLELDDRLDALKTSPLAVQVQRGDASFDFTMTLE